MKRLLALCVVFSLNGCFMYSSQNDCIYGLTSTQCFGEEYPAIAHFQKTFTLGRTDSEQRWRDAEKCGNIGRDKHLSEIWSRTVYADKGGNEKDKNLWNRFENCLQEKGYIWIKHCGRKNSKTDKGICNE